MDLLLQGQLVDDECTGDSGNEQCSLSLRQLRGEKLGDSTTEALSGVRKWSYTQYAVEQYWALGSPSETRVVITKTKGLSDGTKVTRSMKGNPPFYVVNSQSGPAALGPPKPQWQFPKHVYWKGYVANDLKTCNAGDWQSEFITYENGPDFLKAHPKADWTLCKVGSGGGMGGGYRWYLYFVNVSQISS